MTWSVALQLFVSVLFVLLTGWTTTAADSFWQSVVFGEGEGGGIVGAWTGLVRA